MFLDATISILGGLGLFFIGSKARPRQRTPVAIAAIIAEHSTRMPTGMARRAISSSSALRIASPALSASWQ
jgi:hypothetical protein